MQAKEKIGGCRCHHPFIPTQGSNLCLIDVAALNRLLRLHFVDSGKPAFLVNERRRRRRRNESKNRFVRNPKSETKIVDDPFHQSMLFLFLVLTGIATREISG